MATYRGGVRLTSLMLELEQLDEPASINKTLLSDVVFAVGVASLFSDPTQTGRQYEASFAVADAGRGAVASLRRAAEVADGFSALKACVIQGQKRQARTTT